MSDLEMGVEPLGSSAKVSQGTQQPATRGFDSDEVEAGKTLEDSSFPSAHDYREATKLLDLAYHMAANEGLSNLLNSVGHSHREPPIADFESLKVSIQPSTDTLHQSLLDSVLHKSEMLRYEAESHQQNSAVLSQKIDVGLTEIEALLGNR